MRDQNAFLAWLAIGLSFVIVVSMLMSFEPALGEEYKYGIFVFLFLVPVGIAVFFLSNIESLCVGIAVAAVSGYLITKPAWSAMPYSGWPADKGLAAYIIYLIKPLLATGAIWELFLFLVFSYFGGFLSAQARKNTDQVQYSHKAAQETYQKLEYERVQFLSQCKRFSEDINRLNSLIITLSDLAKEIPSVLEVKGVYKLLMEKATELFSAKSCAIFEVDSVSNKLTYVCSIGYDAQTLKDLNLTADEESGIAGWAAKNGKFLSFKDALQDPHMADLLRENKFPILFCQPIVERGKSIAVICVGDMGKELEEQGLIRLTSLLANLSTIAIENARLMEKTKEQAIRDGLTGLYNHRHFYELLEDLMKKAGGQDSILGIFLIDIDHFKKFNDTHGHQIGDLILQETAKLVQQKIQKEDIAARYGGEEFSVVCLRKDTRAISALAEDIRNSVEQTVFQADALRLKVTISLGVAFYKPKEQAGLTTGELVKHSDDALYKSKEGGRNMVSVWEG